ncbi:DNA polymerase epsilon subunit 3 [Termitomyces sp. T112]|nr:DNA polymerase epsilon subunit 3 [Termitomyces sp. T112]
MPRKDAPSGPISAQAQQDLVSDGIENFELPKSLVTKIAKSALPDNAKLQKETVLSLVKGSTVFINYLAATAHDVAISKQHKSISASDVLKALETIEFGDLVENLQNELIIYRANAKTDKKKPPPSSASSAPSAPVPSASGTAAAAAAASAPPRPTIKPKSKPKDLGAPFTSAPLVHHVLPAHAHAHAYSSQSQSQMEVDWEEELGEAASVSVSAAGVGYADLEGEGMGDEGEGDMEDGDDQDLDLEEQDQDEVDDGEDEDGDEGDEEVAEDNEDLMEVEKADADADADGGVESVEGAMSNGIGIGAH